MRYRSKKTWTILLVVLVPLLFVGFLSQIMIGAVQARPAVDIDLSNILIKDVVKAPEVNTNWCVAGAFQGWDNASDPLNDEGMVGDLLADDGVYSLDYTIPITGRYEWKVVECGNWGNAYPAENSWFNTTTSSQTVKFTFDTNDHSNDDGGVVPVYPSQYIVNVIDDLPTSFTAVGDWQGWDNANAATLMSYEGNGIYHLAYQVITPSTYLGKVAATGSWDAFGSDGRSINAGNIVFTTTAVSETVMFVLDSYRGQVKIAPNGSFPGNWCVAGGFQGWDNSSTPLNDDGLNGDLIGDDGVYSVDYVITATGRAEWKVVECGNWGNAYPSENAWTFTTVPSQTVKFTFDAGYDHSGDAGPVLSPTQYIVNAFDDFPDTFTAVGDWQGWDPNDANTVMTPIGNDMFFLTYTIATPGTYQGKVTNDGWNNQVGADGRSINGPNISFVTTENNAVVTFLLDGSESRVGIFVSEPETPVIDPTLIQASIQHPIQDEVFYFVLPDRYYNGDTSNDQGGISGGPLDHGYLITDTGYYHGGDLSGLMMTDTLDYIENLGISAIWLTPVFGNSPVQGNGTINGSSAAYHGYWIIDYESADSHLGTDQELVDFIDAAHARNIKVFFDIVANHTGDIIYYQEGQYTYRNKEDFPYEDENGLVFDDRDYVFSDTFPVMNAATSFPYTPIVDAGDENIKQPAWLNNLLFYHNRGESTFVGENSEYGDFFGLDDLFTERPEVVSGFVSIFTNTIHTYDIDGFRIDTVKHVNIGFWQQVIPEVMDYAVNNGKPDFFMFGEVFDSGAALKSIYTTKGQIPSVLDFGLQGKRCWFCYSWRANG